MYDNHSNCYTLHSKGINGKRIGEWSNNAQISENNNQLEVIQQSLNEYVKYLGSTDTITLKIDSSTGKYQFKVGEGEPAKNPVTFTDTNRNNSYNILYDDNNIIIYYSIPNKTITYDVDTAPKANVDIINAWLYYLGYTGSSLTFIYDDTESTWIPPEDFGNSGISCEKDNQYITLKNADGKQSDTIDGNKTDYIWCNVADIYLKAFGYNNDGNKCSYDSENGWTVPIDLINNKILALTNENNANVLKIHKILFTIDTSKENPEIIKNTVNEIKDNENNLVTNSFNAQYPMLFNENSLTGSTTIVNNGLENIHNVFKNILDDMLHYVNRISLELTCTGEAKWDWGECATIFTINSLKYNISGTNTELIPEGKFITIKKYYNNEEGAKNDITENDVLVELLKNNKLFYDNNSTKYVFNKVDFSGMKYFVYPSKYYKTYDRGIEITPPIHTVNCNGAQRIIRTAIEDINYWLLKYAKEVGYNNDDIKITEDEIGHVVLGNNTFSGSDGTMYTISKYYCDDAYNRIYTNCLQCKFNNNYFKYTGYISFKYNKNIKDILVENIMYHTSIGYSTIDLTWYDNRCSHNNYYNIISTLYLEEQLEKLNNKIPMAERYVNDTTKKYDDVYSDLD